MPNNLKKINSLSAFQKDVHRFFFSYFIELDELIGPFSGKVAAKNVDELNHARQIKQAQEFADVFEGFQARKRDEFKALLRRYTGIKIAQKQALVRTELDSFHHTMLSILPMWADAAKEILLDAQAAYVTLPTQDKIAWISNLTYESLTDYWLNQVDEE
jgi:hypothetical protein